MGREEFLERARVALEQQLWRLAFELDKSLSSAVQMCHFDATDDGAVASVIRASLESAVQEAKIEDSGLLFRTYEKGPARKLEGLVSIGAVKRPVSLEWHIGGPKGGTGKAAHQFAPDEQMSEDMFGYDDAQDTKLLFVVYFLSEARDRIERLFLCFADGSGREKIELRRIESVNGLENDASIEFVHGNAQVQLRVKNVTGERQDDRNDDKREDASTGP